MTRRGFLAGALGAPLAAAAAAPTSYPPIGEFVTVGGLRIHYVARGGGVPVVLLHGASGNLRDFTFSLVDRLAALGLRPVAFDRPGLGYSDRAPVSGWSPLTQARVLRAAADQLGLERPIVLGHSWGGAAAMAWAVEAPGAVRGVVSLAGATYPWGGGVGLIYDLAATDVLGPVVSGVARLLIDGTSPDAVVGRIFRPNAMPPGYAEYIGVPLALRSDAFRNNAEDLTHLNAELAALAPRYKGLPMPVEAVHGGADETVWASVHSEPLSRDVARGRLTILPGVGHMPHHVDEDAAVEAILRVVAAD
jgi:pimeloyl-ACP methyl ester carboxylesterase